MSSPTELLAIAGKSPSPSQVKVKSDTVVGEKNGYFVDAYEKGAQKPALATETESAAAKEPDVPAFPGESTEVEMTSDDVEAAILEKPQTSDPKQVAAKNLGSIPVDLEKTVADDGLVPSVEIAETNAGSATDVEPEPLNVLVDAGTVVAPKMVDETKPLLESAREHLRLLGEEADVENVDPESKQQVDVERQIKLPENPNLVAQAENAVLAKSSPVPRIEPAEERVESVKSIPVETRTMQPIPVNSLQMAARTRSELLPRETEKLGERTIRQESEVKVHEVATKQPPQVTITPPAQLAQPTWIAALQADQPRENLTSFSAVALEELHGYQQQARFEPVSANQRYDAPIQTARQVTQQVAYAVAQTGSGTTEIKLSPEELGRVRMTVQAVEGMINVTVLAERQETGDLMRRYSEMLTEDLRDLGFESINLTFSNEQSDNQTNEDEANSTAEFTEHTPISENGQTVIVSRTLSQGLDLRM